MGGKREGPIEAYPKFWNLNPLTADGREILRIPAWKESFALAKRELEAIMEKEILPATMPEFPIVRRMTLGMNSPPPSSIHNGEDDNGGNAEILH